jgi:hypothetical protein
MTPLPVTKVARNEQRKLQANTTNALGLAFVAVGFVQPVIAGDLTAPLIVKLALCALAGYILHQRALLLLSELED